MYTSFSLTSLGREALSVARRRGNMASDMLLSTAGSVPQSLPVGIGFFSLVVVHSGSGVDVARISAIVSGGFRV